MNSRTAAILVLFNPHDQVEQTIKSIANSVALVIVVVNAASDELISRIKFIDNVEVIVNSFNIGLALALNVGMKIAFEQQQFEYVILFDQDSKPSTNLVGELQVEFIESKKLKIACVAPQLVDLKATGSCYGVNNLQYDITFPRSAPTSGSLISREAYFEVGPMMGDLFIDGIDHEWCFRAYRKGFVVKVSDRVIMKHNMGDVGINFFGQYKPIHRSSFRHYFIIRNSIYLSSLSTIPLRWRLFELFKTIRRIFVYAIVSSNRPESIKLMVKAIHDGFLKKLGPLSTSK